MSAAGSSFVDTAASYIALFIIFVMPVAAIAVFWIVHVLPEKIAERRHHPQKEAIKVLCLLSLVFGGMLWPIAWLWAYTKPVLHKLAYGRDKHDDFYPENAPTAERPVQEELAQLRREIDALAHRGESDESLQPLRRRLARLEPAMHDAEHGEH